MKVKKTRKDRLVRSKARKLLNVEKHAECMFISIQNEQLGLYRLCIIENGVASSTVVNGSKLGDFVISSFGRIPKGYEVIAF